MTINVKYHKIKVGHYKPETVVNFHGILLLFINNFIGILYNDHKNACKV